MTDIPADEIIRDLQALAYRYHKRIARPRMGKPMSILIRPHAARNDLLDLIRKYRSRSRVEAMEGQDG